MPRTNVILFGESGVGKSSIVNMLSEGESPAVTSGRSEACTFESSPFEVNVSGIPVTLWDTAGLNQGEPVGLRQGEADGLNQTRQGGVTTSDALVKLYQLIRNLSDGVSLLMFVARGPRIKSSVANNWKLLYEVICRRMVPIVLVITGLEQEDDMDEWWCDNKQTFQREGIHPGGVAGITAWRGKLKNGLYTFDEEYIESRKKVRRLVKATCLTEPWRVPAAKWFENIMVDTVKNETFMWFWSREVKGKESREALGPAVQKLVRTCRMSESEAEALAEKIRNV